MSDIFKDGSYYKLYTQAKSTSACGLPKGFFESRIPKTILHTKGKIIRTVLLFSHNVSHLTEAGTKWVPKEKEQDLLLATSYWNFQMVMTETKNPIKLGWTIRDYLRLWLAKGFFWKSYALKYPTYIRKINRTIYLFSHNVSQLKEAGTKWLPKLLKKRNRTYSCPCWRRGNIRSCGPYRGISLEINCPTRVFLITTSYLLFPHSLFWVGVSANRKWAWISYLLQPLRLANEQLPPISYESVKDGLPLFYPFLPWSYTIFGSHMPKSTLNT